MKKIALKNAARGTAFDYAGQSWILLENDDGRALCLSKDIIETRAFDEGNCNNFAVASSKEYLNGAYLDNLLEDVNGPNAFLTTELDLTTDDGLKDYGTCTVTIFLLTVDQYRRNRDVIPNADDWWWLSTAFSTKSNGYESLARVVGTDGTLNWNSAYDGYGGLRPACYLDSDLLISVEDDEATDDVTPEHAGEIIAALAEQFGGTFATEDQLTTALSFMLGTLRATREKEARHVALCARPNGGGPETGLYAYPAGEAQGAAWRGRDDGSAYEVRTDGKANALTASGHQSRLVVTNQNGEDLPVYEVVNGEIEIKGKKYPIKLPDGYYVIRKLTPTECERLQTLPDGYTSAVSATQRYRGLGNGWTAEVIIHILAGALKDVPRDEEIVVLSMYDGIGTGRYCLDKMGFTNVTYYAYEIDKPAMTVALSNYPNIIQLGDAFDLRRDDWELGICRSRRPSVPST